MYTKVMPAMPAILMEKKIRVGLEAAFGNKKWPLQLKVYLAA